MSGQYGVIIADPPWQYSNAGVRGNAEDQYSGTMTVADICALPVADLAAPNCVLLCWATWPLLREGLAVVQAWGFEYVTGFPWVKLTDEPRRNLWGDVEFKPQYGTGFWGRGCTELLLIGRRGKVEVPRTASNTVLLLSANFGHSRKPENLYEYAEQFAGPYLELFARRRRPGWDVFGNEVADSIRLGAA